MNQFWGIKDTVPQVYFLKPAGLPGPIKIGFGNTPRARLRQYMEWSPLRLEIVTTVPGSLELERNIQECFVDCHSHAEWFHPHPRLLEAIEQIKSGVPVEKAIDLSNRLGSIRSAKVAVCRARRGTSEETTTL